jgi:predicted amidohydrolase YtcJ
VNHDTDGGSLEDGKRADLALIDRNLFAPSSGPVGDARVDLTVASGHVVYEREL